MAKGYLRTSFQRGQSSGGQLLGASSFSRTRPKVPVVPVEHFPTGSANSRAETAGISHDSKVQAMGDLASRESGKTGVRAVGPPAPDSRGDLPISVAGVTPRQISREMAVPTPFNTVPTPARRSIASVAKDHARPVDSPRDDSGPRSGKPEIGNTEAVQISLPADADPGRDSNSDETRTAVEPRRINRVESSAAATEYRVVWHSRDEAFNGINRARVEREVIRAARTETRKRAEASRESPGASSTEIRVEHLTVRIDSPIPPQPETQGARRPSANSAGDSTSAAYFLRRTLSGF